MYTGMHFKVILIYDLQTVVPSFFFPLVLYSIFVSTTYPVNFASVSILEEAVLFPYVPTLAIVLD